MTKRRMSVDYGPMSLTVGEDSPASGQSNSLAAADEGDVAQFHAAVHKRPRRAAADDEQRSRLTSPFDLLVGATPDRRPTATELGEEIAQLWVSDVCTGVREVRVAMAPRLLPQTTLQIFEDAGRLQVQIRVGCEETQRWLAFSLDALSRDLGRRLQQDLCVSLFDARDDGKVLRRVQWPEDADS